MANPADGIATFFTDDHRECDDAWAALESAASDGEQAKAATLWPTFSQRLLKHLAMEEEVLFPAFEDATGMHSGGPTFMMRHEHTQMRGVLAEMERRLGAKDLPGLLDQGDTLLMLIQQHNAKEEGILYPMAERALGGHWDELAKKLS